MTDKPEVAAKPVAREPTQAMTEAAQVLVMTANVMGESPRLDDLWRAMYDAAPHTHPLVVPEREVLRELVRLHDTQGPVPFGPWTEQSEKAWNAARALLRNTTEAVVCPPRVPTQAMYEAAWRELESIDGTVVHRICAAMYDAFKDEAAKERPDAAAHE